ncbi:MAG: ABC transporter ATP-binding protein [Candidatus Binatus sp.]
MPEYSSISVRRATRQLIDLSRALRLVWQAAPGWTVTWAVLLLVQGFLPVATVYLTRPLVNGIVAAVRSEGNWRPILLPAVLMAIVQLLAELLRGTNNWVRTAEAELVQDHITGLIHRKSISADLAFYESPDFYDHLHRARDEASYRPIAFLEKLGSVLQNGVTLVAMLAVLAGFGVLLPLALLLSTIPVLAMVLRYAVKQHQLRIETTPIERRIWYYDWLLTSGPTAPELRLFILGDYFEAAYRRLREVLRKKRIDLARDQGLAQLMAGASTLVVTAAACVWMLFKTLRGGLSLGDLTLLYQAFQQGLSLARELLRNVGDLYQNTLFLGNLFEFLALEPRVISPQAPVPCPRQLREGIRFQNISFRYPDTQRLALQDFELFVPKGRVVAIVGPNGAGKSTLVKLLCRFYDPEAGSITIDGTDLRDFAVDELRQQITVLFQEPVHYNASVRENIGLGDLSKLDEDGLVRAAAEAAGAEAFIRRLPEGYENLLGHWFDKGVELSVGEWQRLALARAFLRQAPIVILDEPTSAMDPWAEADWLRRFRDLASGRTTLLITHRFTTAMLADQIHVMEEGRVLESGSHQELIAQGGRYAVWRSAQNLE